MVGEFGGTFVFITRFYVFVCNILLKKYKNKNIFNVNKQLTCYLKHFLCNGVLNQQLSCFFDEEYAFRPLSCRPVRDDSTLLYRRDYGLIPRFRHFGIITLMPLLRLPRRVQILSADSGPADVSLPAVSAGVLPFLQPPSIVSTISVRISP